MLHSTRSNEPITISKAILKGLANDGGLFIFDEVKKLDINKLIDLSYQELSFVILREYLDDFSSDDIKWVIDNSYNKDNFKEKIVSLKEFNNYAYLELFNGPTAAFKDFALTMLPNLMSVAKRINGIKEKTRIVVATSGDTGSATLSGFLNKEDFKVTVLYPNNLVSPLQEKQMLLFSEGSNFAYAYDGNFDDCQNLAKKVAILNNKISSANSINIGRLIPQIIYYFYGYTSLVRDNKIKVGDKINVSVPTGNFGNILAGYIAKKMGVPIDKIICASNSNNVLYDAINKGIYDRNRSFIKTYSPSMDILVSSNLERLLYLYYKDTLVVRSKFDEFSKTGIMELKEYKEIFKDFASFYTTNEEILDNIKKEIKDNDYLIDPHTSVAKDAYLKYIEKTNDNKYTLIVSTASPYKFENAFSDLGIKLDYNLAPLAIKKALDIKKDRKVLNKDIDIKALEDIVL